MFQVQHKEFLLVLAAIPFMVLLFFLAVNRKRSISRKLGDPHLVNQLTRYHSPFKFNLKFLLIVFAFIAASFAFANVQSATGGESIARKGIDIMIALDVSNSMLAQDLSPTRLDRAKQVVSRIIDRAGDNRVGIVIFAGKAYLQMPLTGDHSAAKMYLSSASPSAVPTQGTVIGDALRMCHLSFNSKERKYKAVVLLSDGEDHDEGAVEMAKTMASEGVVIHAVGTGSAAGSTVPDIETGQVKTDRSGNPVVSRLNQAALQQLASAGNGTYQLFTTTESVVNNIMGQVNTMDQRAVKDDSLMNYESYFHFLAAAALVLLLIELFLSERKVIREVRRKPAITAMLLLFPFVSFAQEDHELVMQGNELYRKGDLKGAANLYARAAEMNANNQAAIYNLAGVLYKLKEENKSLTAFDMAIKSAKKALDKSNAHYNKGVVLQNSKNPDLCIEEYKNALRINPNDEDARHNLQLALRKQNEKQKQENNDNKSQNNKNEQKPRPSRLSQKDAEQKLQALEQQEKNLHDKLKKANTNASNQPEKDW